MRREPIKSEETPSEWRKIKTCFISYLIDFNFTSSMDSPFKELTPSDFFAEPKTLA